MPAKDTTAPDLLPGRIRTWMEENPDPARTRDVALGLGIPEGMTRSQWVQKVGNAMAREYRRGTLTRIAQEVGQKRPVTRYQLAPVGADA